MDTIEAATSGARANRVLAKIRRLFNWAVERDIIVAWYTGVQQVRGEARLVTHAGALKWSALGLSAPGLCAGPFATWAKPHRSPQP